MDSVAVVTKSPQKAVAKRDWSRAFVPAADSQVYDKKYKNYGVIATVWDACQIYDTAGAKILISLDTEYEFISLDEGNRILSYQVTAIGRGRRMAQLIFHIHDNADGFRLSLGEIVDETRKALGVKPGDLKFQRKQPGAVRVIAHFTTAEWASLRDRRDLAPALNIVRKSPITLGASLVTFKLSNRSVKCGVEIVDTTLIAPDKFRSLGKIGEVLKFPKVELPEGAIENMGALRRNDPALFDLYAITDTRIALAYYLDMLRISRDVLGLEKLGPTLGSLATSKYLDVIGDKAYLEYFGLQRVKRNYKTVVEHIPQRSQVEGFVSDAYMGGLNMAYQREISNCLILDIDFTSCYPSAGATLPAIDWKSVSNISAGPEGDARVFEAAGCTPISVSYVEFEFPEDCLRPTIPVVAGSRGLIYPLRGVGYATHFELEAAKAKGARIRTISEVRFPILLKPDGSPVLAFADFFKLMVEERNKYPAGSLENLTYKGISNAAYGKQAQGVKTRNMRSFASKAKLPPSRITCPAYAGAITGLVRAALIELMDAAEDVGGVVLAATTDGAMIAFPDIPYFENAGVDDVPGLREAFMSKPAIAALSLGRVNSGCDPSPVEVKHVGDEAYVMKTRGYILLAGGVAQHVAKCGHQMPGGDINAHADRLMRYHKSEFIETWRMSTLSSAQKIWDRKAADVVREVHDTRRVNVDYDFKMIPEGEGRFRPPVDVEEFKSWRETVDNIRRKPKPRKDGREQPARRASIERVRLARAGVRIRGTEEDALRRMFLYAIVQDLAGLYPRNAKGDKITQAELAKRAGVSVSDIKNARRREFVKPPRSDIAMHVLLDILHDTHLELKAYTQEMSCLFK